jgi:rhodanese-related sulfurtransferase
MKRSHAIRLFQDSHTGDDLDKLIGEIELIDIREPYEFAGGSIETAKNIPMDTLINAADKHMDKENTYYIMCQSGGRSRMTVNLLTKLGYHVIDVTGGMGSYVGTKKTKA